MYPEEFLKEKGFERKKCKICGKNFWSIGERDICEDCKEKYDFLEEKIAKANYNYIDVWKEFAKMMEKFGYTIIKRYPVIPRWRDDVFFVQASIYDFQPHVVSGDVPPPANPLVVPQFSIRFTDVENVGVTGRHYTGFVMIGRHHFERERYDPNELFEPIYEWLTKGMKIPEEKLVFIEDWWEGGGNAGPCIESWSGGVELLNTVFMRYKTTESGLKELDIKVLDEGSGQERWAWFTSNEPVSYLVVFPRSIDYISKSEGIKIDKEILREIMKYSKNLDIKKDFSWIAEKLGLEESTVKYYIYLFKDLFSIPDHVRTLLFSIKDGAIPSNTGPGYYLRVLFRKIFESMRKRDWNFDLIKLFELEMRFLREEFPDIVDPDVLEVIKEIIDVEREKWIKTRREAKKIIKKIKEITPEVIINLYESHGITPEMLEEEGIKVPEDVYKVLVREKRREKKKRIMEDIPEIETEKVYYENPYLDEIEAKVLKIIGNKVILDKTIFYPEGGGQKYDKGKIGESNVLEVRKVGKTIIHIVDKVTFKEGDVVKLKLDVKRRMRIMRHHTATHVLIQSARRVLGPHVWQQGAEKDEEIARLDISHYKDLTIEEIQKIERLANQIVLEGRKVKVYWMDRNKAEEKFGFIIYQGGVVPGKEIRIVEIEDWDVQACAGLHVENTKDIGIIKIVKVQKVKDGVYRFWFRAWDQGIDEMLKRDKVLLELAKKWNISVDEVKERAIRFYEEWKEYMKKSKKLEEWILNKIKDALIEGKIVEGPEEIKDGFYVALLKELERKGMENKAIMVGNKVFILGNEEEFKDIIKGKNKIREIGKVIIYE